VPYFITNESPDCSGWATIKEDGEVIGCHQTKEDAIAQMVAVSIAEKMPPGGERDATGADAVIVDIDGTLIYDGERVETVYDYVDELDAEIFIVTGRPESQRAETIAELNGLDIDYDDLFMNPGSSADSTEHKKMVATELLKVWNVVAAIENNPDAREAYAELGIPVIDPAKIEPMPQDLEEDPEEEVEEMRAVNLAPPAYMRAAARRGLKYYEEGLAGDGLQDATVREARAMASGNVTADKWVRIAAWIARHLVDLDAPKNNDPSRDDYPGAGLVAHLLWGSGPTKDQAVRAMRYAEGVVERIRAENEARYQLHLEKESKGSPMGKSISKIEHRTNEVKFELRAVEDNAEAGMTFSGYAAVFNSESEPLPFTEVIAPGAFARSLKSRNDVKLLVNHDTGRVLGSTRANTLRLIEDANGLRAEADLPPTSDGKDISILLQRGDIRSMSFGFTVPAGGDSWNAEGTVRTLKSVRLHEVSIVTFPAYEATSASVRSLDATATRANVDADELADAILKIEANEDLTERDAEVIGEVVGKLTRKTEIEQPAEIEPTISLDVLSKKLDLLKEVI
jgi:HK97 family phage prohead protease